MNPILGMRGAVVAPHSLAAQAGLDILREGGNAIEATIAVASTLAVVYPHMTGIGGDGFWLMHRPGMPMLSIDACGATGAAVNRSLYQGLDSIPWRGPLAANTVAGTVSGWGAAYEHSRTQWGGKLPFARLLESAIHYARHGFAVTHSQEQNTRNKLAELQNQPYFARTFLKDGQVPVYGQRHAFPELAKTLEQIARAGAEDFYRGDLAQDGGERGGGHLRFIAYSISRVTAFMPSHTLRSSRNLLRFDFAASCLVGKIRTRPGGITFPLLSTIFPRMANSPFLFT